MTDTLTPVLGLTLQTIGGNRNTWGNTNNTNFASVEEAFCGSFQVSTTGGPTTLTQAQARQRFIIVSGALLSDATIIVPNQWRDWIFFNVTSGGFAVLIKTAAGTPASIPASTTTGVFCNGSDGVGRLDLTTVGQMAFFANSAVPEGWLECNGAAVSRAGLGIDLFARIGTTWGVGNGATTFNIPNAYTAGKFLRSRTASVTVGTAQSDQNQAHVHALTAASIGSGGGHTPTGSIGANGAHSHIITISDPTHAHAATQGNFYEFVGVSGGFSAAAGANATNHANTAAAATGIGASADTASSHVHSLTMDPVGTHTHVLSGTTDSAGSAEARPTNLSAILCIKY